MTISDRSNVENRRQVGDSRRTGRIWGCRRHRSGRAFGSKPRIRSIVSFLASPALHAQAGGQSLLISGTVSCLEFPEGLALHPHGGRVAATVLRRNDFDFRQGQKRFSRFSATVFRCGRVVFLDRSLWLRTLFRRNGRIRHAEKEDYKTAVKNNSFLGFHQHLSSMNGDMERAPSALFQFALWKCRAMFSHQAGSRRRAGVVVIDQ